MLHRQSHTSLQVWYNNVPHTKLVEDKGGQNWISRKKDKFTFPGGGTQFIHGADQYLNQFSQVIKFCAEHLYGEKQVFSVSFILMHKFSSECVDGA